MHVLRRFPIPLAAAVIPAGAGGGGCTTAPPRADEAPVRPLAIEPMTTIGADGSGYFSDPYAVGLAPTLRRREIALSGTTKVVLSCAVPVSAACFAAVPVHVDAGTLRAPIAAAGDRVTIFQNLDLFQDGGGWHAVLAMGVRTPTRPHWTVLVHAHPTLPASPDAIPLSWSADTLLAGSFARPSGGDDGGKYLHEDGWL